MIDQDAPAWFMAVNTVLKGAAFETLVAHSRDGIAIEPLYPKAEDRARPCRDATRAIGIIQRVDHPDPAEANRLAHAEIAGGATGLDIVVDGAPNSYGFGVGAVTVEDFQGLLRGLPLDRLAVRLNAPHSFYQNGASRFRDAIASLNFDLATLDLDVGLDPIGRWAASLFDPGRGAAGTPERGVGAIAMSLRSASCIRADGRPHHAAGASEGKELAAVLATAVTSLRVLESTGLESARDALTFTLAADADQFLTMAKFRALRRLWARIEQACGLAPRPMQLHAETAWRMLTRLDAQTNMVRNTIATAAAILGGADSVTVLPHTSALGLPDPFARRLARNTALVLLGESSLGRVADPAAGSGAIEALTEALCIEAWRLFQGIEAGGGLEAALSAGTWQTKIARVRAARQADLASEKTMIVGVTQFAPPNDAAPSVLLPMLQGHAAWRDARPFEVVP